MYYTMNNGERIDFTTRQAAIDHTAARVTLKGGDIPIYSTRGSVSIVTREPVYDYTTLTEDGQPIQTGTTVSVYGIDRNGYRRAAKG